MERLRRGERHHVGLRAVERAGNTTRLSVEIAHCRLKARVPHDDLNVSDKGPSLHRVRRVTVAQAMWCDRAFQTSLTGRGPDAPLHIRLVTMPSNQFARARMSDGPMRRE